MILKFNVKEQTISLVNTKSVPRIGSKDYLVLQFSFSSDWENLNKLVYLQNGDVSQPIDIVDNLVEVPEWFTEQDSFNVTLFGTDGTTEVPTNVVSVQLEKSNDLWVKDAPEPQPSWLVSVLDAAELVKEATVHGPTIGSNGNWYTWDFESKQYIDTGVAASGGSDTTDHTKLTNRDAENQHPMSAITGLVGALNGKVSVADIINNLTTNVANKPLSAAQGVALKALIDAISIPDKLPNPNALTFTGAVTGSYDGSAPLEVEIPSGGGGGTSEEFILLAEVTLEEDVKKVTLPLSSPTKHFITRMWCPKISAASDPMYISIGINGNISNLLYYLQGGHFPSKDNRSQCTVEAHGLNDGNWAISAYTNLGDAEGVLSNYNPNVRIPIGVKNNGIMQAESVVFDVATNDATQYFPVGSILSVWGV